MSFCTSLSSAIYVHFPIKDCLPSSGYKIVPEFVKKSSKSFLANGPAPLLVSHQRVVHKRKIS